MKARCRTLRPLQLWACIATVGALCLLPRVQAQETSETLSSQPEALRNIKRADGICRRDEFSSASVAATSRSEELLGPDLTCAVAASEAFNWAEASDTVFIDTRLPAEFGQYGIRGALNLRAADLPSKPFLKGKRIVLFGNGKGEQELLRSCAALKQQGFSKTRVRGGGLPMWQLAQHPLIGKPPSTTLLSRLDAAELWQESRFDGNVVLVTASQAALQANLPLAVKVDSLGKEAVVAAVERRRKELKGTPVASLVVVAGNELDDSQFAGLQRSLAPLPLLRYADSSDAFALQMDRQAASWKAQALGPRKPGCGL